MGKFVECTPQQLIELLTRAASEPEEQLGPKRPLGPEAMALVRARSSKIVPLCNELELCEKRAASIKAQLDLLHTEFTQQMETLMPELGPKDWKITFEESCIQIVGDNGDPLPNVPAAQAGSAGPSVH